MDQDTIDIITEFLYDHNNVHIWSPDEITDLPRYGTWFYGLVKISDMIFLCEVYPGLGYSSFEIYRSEDGRPTGTITQYADIGSDIRLINPDYLASRYFDHSDQLDNNQLDDNWLDDTHVTLWEPPDDNRSLFLKLLDMRYLIDFFLENSYESYTEKEIRDAGNDTDNLTNELKILSDIGILYNNYYNDHYNYRLNHDNDITKSFLSLESVLSRNSVEISDILKG